MKKRITSLLLTLAMLLSLLPAMGVTASAAASGDGTEEHPRVVTTYDEWKAAMQQSSETYIKLGNNIDASTLNSGFGLGSSEDVRVQAKIHLDLNGKKLTLKKSIIEDGGEIQFIRLIAGELIIKDSVGSGEIVGVNNVTLRYMRLIDVFDGAKLTLNSGKLNLKVNANTVSGSETIMSTGTVEINGGTVAISLPDDRNERGSYVNDMDCALRSSGEAVINGGTFDGRVVLEAVAKASGVVDNVINGGDFKQSLYIQKNKAVTGDVPLNVSIQGGTYHYTPGYRKDIEDKESDPLDNFQFATYGFTKRNQDYTYYPKEDGTWRDYTAEYDMNAFASIFPKNAIISATGQEYELIDSRFPAKPVKCEDAVYTGSSSALDLARLVNSHYKTVTVTTLPSDALKDMKLTVGSDGTPLPAKGNSNVYGDVTLGSDGTLTKNVYITAIGNKQLKEMYYSNPSKIDFGYRLNIFKDGKRVDYTGVISQTYTATSDDEISVSVQLRDFEFKEGVYTIRLALWPYLRGSEARIGENLVGLWKLTAKEAPPAPVAHSIKIENTHGTATPSTAMAGQTVTVTANDRTAENMMFTQWYTETAGVTFTNVTDRVTTFTMPDCDVVVNPGYHGVSFTRQPLDTWLSSVSDSKVYFAFSQPITSWELVNEDNTTLDSGDAESANALVEATLAPQPKDTVMTCRVIVTANGQNFTSRTFDLKWYNVPGAPNVKVYPAGGKFVETLDVNLETPNTYWWIAYTTDGSDPYDKSGPDWKLNPRAQLADDSIQVKISEDTIIKACLYNSEGDSNMEIFGDIVTCDFTKVELTPPVADPPSGTSFYDRLNVSLSTDIVNAKIMVSYNNGDVNDLSDPNQWKEYEPEKESITLSGSYGMHGFDAVTGIRMEGDDGSTYWVHSDKQEYLYPRITYADMANASVTGKVNEEITPVDVSITLHGDVFAENLTAGKDVSSWFTNLPLGLKATVKEKTNYTATLVVTISGTPMATSAAAIHAKMPTSALRYTGNGTAIEQTVLPNSKAVYNIVEDGTHTHTYGNWTMLDDSLHSKSCTAGDDVQFEAHTWQWVVDTHATSTTAGSKHEECTVCGATRNANTVIPATGGGSSSGGGSTGGGGGAGVTTYAITVQNSKNGAVTASHKSAAKDTAVTLTVTPDKGYVLDTLTVLDSKDKAVKLTEKNGKYTFTMPAGKVTVSAAFKAAAPASENPFTDVPSGAYYEDAVIWAVKEDITSGTSATTFNPDGSCTRAQAVTFLWRAAGSPEPKSAAMPFTDVPAGSYFEKAVLWAVENGITKGTSDTTFGPDASCTRAQIVTFLWRAGGSPAVSGNSAFSDVAADAYYAAAVAWAEKNGVTGGIGGGLFGSDNTCTRAQIVTFLHRAMK